MKLLILVFLSTSFCLANCQKSFRRKITLKKKTQERIQQSSTFYLKFFKDKVAEQDLIFINSDYTVTRISHKQLKQIHELTQSRSFLADDEQMRMILELIPNYHMYTLPPGQYYSAQAMLDSKYLLQDLEKELADKVLRKEIMEDSHVSWSIVERAEKAVSELQKKVDAIRVLSKRMNPLAY